MRDSGSFYDIFLIYHPDDIDEARRLAAQLRATGVRCFFDEEDFGKTAASIEGLKASLLRAYTVAIALSPHSAESQLCNELLEYAVANSKPLVSLILREDIEVDVHPAIAQHPFVYFREEDDLVDRVEELRLYLVLDDNLRLHTELLVAAHAWREAGRPPSMLLPADRMEEARRWLATGAARHPKPSALQVEYIHGSRRSRPRRRRPSATRLAAAFSLLFALGLLLALLALAIDAIRRGQAEAAATRAASANEATRAAEATAASQGAFGLIDAVAATSERLSADVISSATAEAIAELQASRATQRAQAAADQRATQARATLVFEMARDEGAERLIEAGEAALARGEADLALALGWEAKDSLDDPRSAYRLLRRAIIGGPRLRLDEVALSRLDTAGGFLALVPASLDRLRIYNARAGELSAELSDHAAAITVLEYSGDGRFLLSGADDGEIIIRDGAAGEPLRRLQAHQAGLTAIALYPAGDAFASAGRSPQIALWDIETGERLAAYDAEDSAAGEITDLHVSADGGRLIGLSGDAALHLASHTLAQLDDELAERALRGIDEQAGIAYSGGRSLPAFPGDPHWGELVLWDLAEGRQLARLTDGFNWSLLGDGDLSAATDDLRFIAFHEDRALAVVQDSNGAQRAQLIQIDGGRSLERFTGEIAGQVAQARFIDPLTAVAALEDGRVVLWSLADGTLIRELAQVDRPVASLEANASAGLATARLDDGGLLLWQLGDPAAQPLHSLPAARHGTAISADGVALLLVEETGASLRVADTLELVAELEASQLRVAGDQVAVVEAGRVALYDMRAGEALRSWDWAGGAIQTLYPAPAAAQALVVDEAADLWLVNDAATAPQRLLRAEPASLAVFSPSGDRLLTAHDERAILWDSGSGDATGAFPFGAAFLDLQAVFSAKGETLHFFFQLEGGLAGLTVVNLGEAQAERHAFVDVSLGALTSDGERLALALGDGRVQLIDAADAAVVSEIQPGESPPTALRYLAEAGALVIVSGRELSLWDAKAAALEQRFQHPLPIVEFSLSEDGARILTVDAAGAFRLWAVESPAQLLERVETLHRPRALTCDERARYIAPPLCE